MGKAKKPKKTEQKKVPGLVWSTDPEQLPEDLTSKRWRWEDSSGTYRVERLIQKLGGENGFPNCFAAFYKSVVQTWLDNQGRKMEVPTDSSTWRSVEMRGDRGQVGNYPRRYKTLNAALEACDTHHAESHGEDKIHPPSNRGVAVQAAEALGMAEVPAVGKEARGRPAVPGRPLVEVLTEETPVGGSTFSPTTPRAGARKGTPVVGTHSLSDILVWMGRCGWTYEQVRKVLASTGHGDASDNTVRSRIGAGRTGRLSPPKLTPGEENTLENLKNA